MLATLDRLQPSDFPTIRRRAPTTLQVNLGYLCNQQCLHCHVAAGPNRREIMSAETIDLVLEDDADLERRAQEPPGHPWLEGSGPPVVLGVGRLVPQKDFATLLDAFAKVRAQTPARLVILGEGRELAALEGWTELPY